MPVLPIDTGRYGTQEMRRIFEEEPRFQKMLEVESALAWAHSEVGNIPRRDAERVMIVVSAKRVKLSRMKEIEREIKHDLMSMVRALAEACGPSGPTFTSGQQAPTSWTQPQRYSYEKLWSSSRRD